MEEKAKRITESELEVMHLLWEAVGPLTIAEIRQGLQEKTGWEPTTIKTLVQRLCTKGAVIQEKRDVFYYHPALSEQEYNRWATVNLIHRLYRGSAKSLVASLLRAEELTEEDVEELRAMFREGDKS